MSAASSTFGSDLAQVSWGEPLAASHRERSLPDGPLTAGTITEIWRKRTRYRRHLARLMATGSGLVEDIGLTLEQAEQEIKKPFWRR
jgi:uncharacterized protein YjiS (DUF1127 family)